MIGAVVIDARTRMAIDAVVTINRRDAARWATEQLRAPVRRELVAGGYVTYERTLAAEIYVHGELVEVMP